MSFEQFVNFASSQSAIIIYGILIISAFTENIIPPFPGDLITLAGAFIAGQGNISYFGIIVSVLTGSFGGGLLIYHLGKTKGRAILEKNSFLKITSDKLDKVESLFARHGIALIIFSRFMAGIRSIIIVTAGIAGMPAKRVSLFMLISIILWNGILIGLMVLTKSNWGLILQIMKDYSLIFTIITTIILLILILRYLWLKRRS